MQLDQKHMCHVTKVKTAYTVIPTTAHIPLPLFAATWFYVVSIEMKKKRKLSGLTKTCEI
jgi:hypothetical protein